LIEDVAVELVWGFWFGVFGLGNGNIYGQKEYCKFY
jgi:hypothetical protein